MTDRAPSLPSALWTLVPFMITLLGNLSAGYECLANDLSRYRHDVAGSANNFHIEKL